MTKVFAGRSGDGWLVKYEGIDSIIRVSSGINVREVFTEATRNGEYGICLVTDVEPRFKGNTLIPKPALDWVDVTEKCTLGFIGINQGHLLRLCHNGGDVGMIGANQWEGYAGDGEEGTCIIQDNYRLVRSAKTAVGTEWFRIEHYQEVD